MKTQNLVVTGRVVGEVGVSVLKLALAARIPGIEGAAAIETVDMMWRLGGSRAEDYLRRLVSRLSKEDVERIAGDSEASELIEKGLEQAFRAATEERRERLAELVSRGLTSKELSAARCRHLLKVFGDIDDSEVIMLKTFGSSGEKHRELTRKHREIVFRPLVENGASPDSDPDGQAVYDSQISHLRQHGLLEGEGARFIREVGSGRGPSPIVVSTFGMLLLRYIGEGEE